MDELLKERQLWFVTGKGGVGKSTICAALGTHLAARERETLIVEAGTYSVLEDFFGPDDTSGEFRRVGEHLRTTRLDISECFVETVSKFLPSKRLVRAVLGNRFVQRFFDAAPGVNELVFLDHIVDIVQSEEPSFDHVIVDLPASGHAVTFLRVPRMLKRAIRVGAIASHAERIAEIIEDPNECGVAAVSLPEQMPVNETIELADRLVDAVSRPLDAVFMNMRHRSPVSGELRPLFEELIENRELESFALKESGGRSSPDSDRALERILSGNAMALDWYDRDRRYAEQLEEQIGSIPVFDIPVIYSEGDREILEGVARHLAGIEY